MYEFYAAAIGGCFVLLCLICWRVLTCLQSVVGSDKRARDRERQDYIRTISQMAEKASIRQPADMIQTTQMHLTERMNAASNNVELEKAALRNDKPKEPVLVSTGDENGAYFR